MSVTIPLPQDSDHFSFVVELDGTSYGFEWVWNYRDSHWYFSVNDANGSALVAYRKAVTTFPLLDRFTARAVPQGTLLLHDTSGAYAEPGLTDLGARVQLLYYPVSETAPL